MAEVQKVTTLNCDAIRCDGVYINSTRPRLNLPDVPIPDGQILQIKNNPGNPIGTIIFVDFGDLKTFSWPLSLGETVGYEVKNASAITVGVFTIAVGTQLIVNFTVEVNKR